MVGLKGGNAVEYSLWEMLREIVLGLAGLSICILLIVWAAWPTEPGNVRRYSEDDYLKERPATYWMSQVDEDLDFVPDEIEHWFD